MAQWLITLLFSTEDMGSVPSTHISTSQQSLTLVPEDPTSASVLCGYQAYTRCTHLQGANTHEEGFLRTTGISFCIYSNNGPICVLKAHLKLTWNLQFSTTGSC